MLSAWAPEKLIERSDQVFHLASFPVKRHENGVVARGHGVAVHAIVPVPVIGIDPVDSGKNGSPKKRNRQIEETEKRRGRQDCSTFVKQGKDSKKCQQTTQDGQLGSCQNRPRNPGIIQQDEAVLDAGFRLVVTTAMHGAGKQVGRLARKFAESADLSIPRILPIGAVFP
ncbi:hypothetical protein [Salaquimonas pukyongi]|uniref:hypothetical protein n=1 Tax=Salaquimonas pukyongi TaxID=2712698 RepID=UPI001FCDFC24|nr:hypothetical protein [Salaquimonas pukyongi]